jgi:DNA-binding HxlR family transcriptional regulator
MPESRPSAAFAYNCPVEVPVRVLGGKWKLIILYHLLTGPQRNGELLRLVPGITRRCSASNCEISNRTAW